MEKKLLFCHSFADKLLGLQVRVAF